MKNLMGLSKGRTAARHRCELVHPIEAMERRVFLSADPGYLHASSVLPGVSTGEGVVVGEQAVICGDTIDDNPFPDGGPVEIFDAATNRWSYTGVTPLPGKAMVSIDGLVLFAGGGTGSGFEGDFEPRHCLKSIEHGNLYTEVTSYETPRAHG